MNLVEFLSEKVFLTVAFQDEFSYMKYVNVVKKCLKDLKFIKQPKQIELIKY